MLAVAITLQCFYVLAAATILLANSIPSLRTRFVAYGKATHSTNRSSKDAQKRDGGEKLLDFLETFTVPHSYFTHFYLLSVASSLFWGYQIATHGAAYRYLAGLKLPDGMVSWGGALETSRGGAMGIQQVAVVWLAMLVQGARRSYECLYIQKQGQASRMWIVHYLVGLAFYATVNIALWIEGTDALDGYEFTPSSVKTLVGMPSFKSLIGIPIFIMASGLQFDCHGYLASLEKYSLPEHPAFEHIVCPHYFAECLIYFALAVLGAPRGMVVNWTLWTVLMFVGVNLGIASKMNRDWYEKKFGKEALKLRYNMIPAVF